MTELNWPILIWIGFNALTIMTSIFNAKPGNNSVTGFLLAVGFMVIGSALLHAGATTGFLLLEASLWFLLITISLLLQALSPPNAVSSAPKAAVASTIRLLIAVAIWFWAVG